MMGNNSAPTFLIILYRFLTWLLSPLAWVFLMLRAYGGKEDMARLGERLGKYIVPRPNGTLVWLHGTSVGESLVGLSLAKEMRKLRPDLRFLFTSTTITSANIIAKSLIMGDVHQYVPVDTGSAVNRFLNHFTPDFAIFLEGEIWPNLILATKSRGIKMALVNARMTAKSTGNWQKYPKTAAQLFGCFDYVHPADAQTKAALESLGARNIAECRNLKLAAPAPSFSKGEVKTIAQSIGNRPIWLAASTHAGEEEIIIAAHKKILAIIPNALLIIAPRHPVRADEVFRLCTKFVKRRSLGQLPDKTTEIYLWDTIGELGNAFKLANISLMAGSLLPNIGGHNPIEPAQLGSAVISGKYIHNFQNIYDEMATKSAAIILKETSGEEIAASVGELLLNQERRQALMKAADLFAKSGSKTLGKVAAVLLTLIGGQN